MNELKGLAIYQGDVSSYSDIAAAFAKTWQQYERLDFGKFVLGMRRTMSNFLPVFSNAGLTSRGSFYEEQAESERTTDGLPIPPNPDNVLRNIGTNRSYKGEAQFELMDE